MPSIMETPSGLSKIYLEAESPAMVVSPPIQSGVESWDAEYRETLSIPSSRRMLPSKALQTIREKFGILGKSALDLGSGNGRNSAFLDSIGFQVTSLDFSTEAMRLASELFSERGRIQNFNPAQMDILEGLPFDSGAFDVVLDAYCTCHILDLEAYDRTLQEVARVMKTGGQYFRLHLDDQDLYYRERIVNRDSAGFISLNIRNSIYKRHYSEARISRDLSKYFSKVTPHHVAFDDVVDGRLYLRSITALVCIK